MWICDAHCHVFPDKIADKAVDSIGRFYDLKMNENGRTSNLLNKMDQNDIDHAVIFTSATTPEQVGSINEYIAKQVQIGNGRFTGLGTMHPDSKDPERDFNQILSLGLHGIKIHHDFLQIAVDDPRCMPIYELAQGKIPVLLHTGDYRYDLTNPNRVEPILKNFPQLLLIGAHLGGWSIWEEASEKLASYENFAVDCSSSLYGITPETARTIFDRYGLDRVMYGTDYPMWSEDYELENVRKIRMTPEEREKVMGLNAARIYRIERN